MSDARFSEGKVKKGGVNKPPTSPRPDVKVCPQVPKPSKGATTDDDRIKALARDTAEKTMGYAGRGGDRGATEYAALEIDRTIRTALSESKWPTCHKCSGILIFDQEEPVASCENGCYTTEWGSQANGDHWREVQQKLMARGQRKISSEKPGA